MSSPDGTAPMQIDMQAVVEELRQDPLSKALLERAQFLTLLRDADKELRYLRAAAETPAGGS